MTTTYALHPTGYGKQSLIWVNTICTFNPSIVFFGISRRGLSNGPSFRQTSHMPILLIIPSSSSHGALSLFVTRCVRVDPNNTLPRHLPNYLYSVEVSTYRYLRLHRYLSIHILLTYLNNTRYHLLPKSLRPPTCGIRWWGVFMRTFVEAPGSFDWTIFFHRRDCVVISTRGKMLSLQLYGYMPKHIYNKKARYNRNPSSNDLLLINRPISNRNKNSSLVLCLSKGWNTAVLSSPTSLCCF